VLGCCDTRLGHSLLVLLRQRRTVRRWRGQLTPRRTCTGTCPVIRTYGYGRPRVRKPVSVPMRMYRQRTGGGQRCGPEHGTGQPRRRRQAGACEAARGTRSRCCCGQRGAWSKSQLRLQQQLLLLLAVCCRSCCRGRRSGAQGWGCEPCKRRSPYTCARALLFLLLPAPLQPQMLPLPRRQRTLTGRAHSRPDAAGSRDGTGASDRTRVGCCLLLLLLLLLRLLLLRGELSPQGRPTLLPALFFAAARAPACQPLATATGSAIVIAAATARPLQARSATPRQLLRLLRLLPRETCALTAA